MAETSMFWTTNGTGDGPVDGYPATSWLELLRTAFLYDPDTQGPFKRYLNELEVTNPSGRDLQVDTGGALVYGFPYWNGSATTKALTHPTTGTTGWRLVLQAGWTAQTVRIALKQATDGTATPPAVTQDPGTTFEISLAYGTITTEDVVAITDARGFLTANTEVVAAMLKAGTFTADAGGRAPFAAGFVDNALIRDSAALSVIGRASNSAGDVADIAASSDNTVLRRSGASIGFGKVAGAQVDTGTITAANIENRTRSVLIPATRGYVTNTSNPLHAADERGIMLDDGVVSMAIGDWYLPLDYVSGLTIAAVIECDGDSGNAYMRLDVFMGADGQAYNTHNDYSGYSAVAAEEAINEALSVSVTSVAAGDYITCRLTRNAQSGTDTFNTGKVYVKGFLASYTADS